eukprot:4838656-Prymnesium_polylepis.2
MVHQSAHSTAQKRGTRSQCAGRCGLARGSATHRRRRAPQAPCQPPHQSHVERRRHLLLPVLAQPLRVLRPAGARPALAQPSAPHLGPSAQGGADPQHAAQRPQEGLKGRYAPKGATFWEPTTRQRIM